VPPPDVVFTVPAGFRLDSYEGATAATDGKSVFVFGGSLHATPIQSGPTSLPPFEDAISRGALYVP
jgi:hypothetical protein